MEIVDLALTRGHKVTAFVPSPRKLRPDVPSRSCEMIRAVIVWGTPNRQRTGRDFSEEAYAYRVRIGGFKTTTSTTVQVRTGFVASFFNNALQATVGWNLNVAEKRMYWGIGFGFLRIDEQIATFVKK